MPLILVLNEKPFKDKFVTCGIKSGYVLNAIAHICLGMGCRLEGEASIYVYLAKDAKMRDFSQIGLAHNGPDGVYADFPLQLSGSFSHDSISGVATTVESDLTYIAAAYLSQKISDNFEPFLSSMAHPFEGKPYKPYITLKEGAVKHHTFFDSARPAEENKFSVVLRKTSFVQSLHEFAQYWLLRGQSEMPERMALEKIIDGSGEFHGWLSFHPIIVLMPKDAGIAECNIFEPSLPSADFELGLYSHKLRTYHPEKIASDSSLFIEVEPFIKILSAIGQFVDGSKMPVSDKKSFFDRTLDKFVLYEGAERIWGGREAVGLYSFELKGFGGDGLKEADFIAMMTELCAVCVCCDDDCDIWNFSPSEEGNIQIYLNFNRIDVGMPSGRTACYNPRLNRFIINELSQQTVLPNLCPSEPVLLAGAGVSDASLHLDDETMWMVPDEPRIVEAGPGAPSEFRRVLKNVRLLTHDPIIEQEGRPAEGVPAVELKLELFILLTDSIRAIFPGATFSELNIVLSCFILHGGAVRDHILGEEINDYDFTVKGWGDSALSLESVRSIAVACGCRKAFADADKEIWISNHNDIDIVYQKSEKENNPCGIAYDFSFNAFFTKFVPDMGRSLEGAFKGSFIVMNPFNKSVAEVFNSPIFRSGCEDSLPKKPTLILRLLKLLRLKQYADPDFKFRVGNQLKLELEIFCDYTKARVPSNSSIILEGCKDLVPKKYRGGVRSSFDRYITSTGVKKNGQFSTLYLKNRLRLNGIFLYILKGSCSINGNLKLAQDVLKIITVSIGSRCNYLDLPVATSTSLMQSVHKPEDPVVVAHVP